MDDYNKARGRGRDQYYAGREYGRSEQGSGYAGASRDRWGEEYEDNRQSRPNMDDNDRYRYQDDDRRSRGGEDYGEAYRGNLLNTDLNTGRDWHRGGGIPGRGGHFDHHHDSQHHASDPHYRSWRQRQMDQFDQDYRDYRQERQDQFNQDFDEWREQRAASRSSDEVSEDASDKTA
ncbi:MAG: hypothetical protein ABGW87_14260 [Sphingomonadaceae bacterium]